MNEYVQLIAGIREIEQQNAALQEQYEKQIAELQEQVKNQAIVLALEEKKAEELEAKIEELTFVLKHTEKLSQERQERCDKYSGLASSFSKRCEQLEARLREIEIISVTTEGELDEALQKNKELREELDRAYEFEPEPSISIDELIAICKEWSNLGGAVQEQALDWLYNGRSLEEMSEAGALNLNALEMIIEWLGKIDERSVQDIEQLIEEANEFLMGDYYGDDYEEE